MNQQVLLSDGRKQVQILYRRCVNNYIVCYMRTDKDAEKVEIMIENVRDCYLYFVALGKLRSI